MKDINPSRFLRNRKPEELDFKGQDIPDSPTAEAPGPQERVRPSGRSDNAVGSARYNVVIPKDRRKIRHPFDIYEDQLEVLKRLQFAAQDEAGSKAMPTLGEMAGQALDQYLPKEVQRSGKINLIWEQDAGI
jgi:hypothetical protein